MNSTRVVAHGSQLFRLASKFWIPSIVYGLSGPDSDVTICLPAQSPGQSPHISEKLALQHLCHHQFKEVSPPAAVTSLFPSGDTSQL